MGGYRNENAIKHYIDIYPPIGNIFAGCHFKGPGVPDSLYMHMHDTVPARTPNDKLHHRYYGRLWNARAIRDTVIMLLRALY